MPDDSEPPADVYKDHVSELLEAEYNRRNALEARGESIIKTSSGIIALIFALTIFISGKDYKFTNHWSSIWLLVASLVTFVASAVIAIYLQSWGLRYTMTGKKTLEGMTQDLWSLAIEDAQRMVLQRNINTTLSLRDGNDKKASAAQYSVILQVFAILLLSVSLIFELTGERKSEATSGSTQSSLTAAPSAQPSPPATSQKSNPKPAG